ncbi:MAG: hypothetical protein UHM19_04260 [Bacteroidales bacterium]|nr:hypothetical protein [Bacteroidales bacterium]
MKRTLLLICTLLCANVLFAQEQLAVLKHNDSTSVFYGQTAFKQAYNAATHGDIITLSDGIFESPQEAGYVYGIMTKSITVRGNGAIADSARRSTGTYFMDEFKVLGLGDSLQFSAEGIYFDDFRASNSHNIKLTRCYINSFNPGSGVQATNCIIKGSVGGSSSQNNTYINCVINKGASHLPNYAICNNCIISGYDNSNNNSYQYNNCVIIKKGTYNNDTILNGAVNYSVLIGFTGSNSPASSGNVVMSLSDVFENWDGESLPTDLETYVLKSSVSDSIQSLDGTEVGIFGGFMPFEWRPSYSIIKRFNVANRTTADGKLSVDIEVISE